MHSYGYATFLRVFERQHVIDSPFALCHAATIVSNKAVDRHIINIGRSNVDPIYQSVIKTSSNDNNATQVDKGLNSMHR